jgi:hypothetical protein
LNPVRAGWQTARAGHACGTHPGHRGRGIGRTIDQTPKAALTGACCWRLERTRSIRLSSVRKSERSLQSVNHSLGPGLQRYPRKHCGLSRLGAKAGSVYSPTAQKLPLRTKRS